MNWFILFVAGLFEVAWAVGLKYTDGFTRLWPSVGTAVAIAISTVLLAVALKTLPVGTGYATWVGIGAIGTAIAGMVLFGESVSTLKIVSIVLLVTGIAGLKLGSAA
jgi:quaternary ammonium compound-resistance protein SugE